MTGEPHPNQKTVGCPKQPWILLTFSDDEALPPGSEIPAGLRFHLSRCPSCRAIAERLSALTADLGAMASDESHDELSGRAASRARSALLSGAALTGRVTIEDDTTDPWATNLAGKAPFGSTTRALVALAACVGLMLSLVAMWRLIDRPGQRSTQFTVDSWRVPTREVEPRMPTVRDLAGPSNESDAGIDVADVDDSAEADPVYVLAPDDARAAHRRQMPASATTKTVTPADTDAFLSERFLDKPASAVSTVNSTKDRQ